nr:hypothetical protein [uncultured Noviherbaspirillum sp.]
MPRWVTTDYYRCNFEEHHSTDNSKSRKYADGVWQNNFWQAKNESVDNNSSALAAYCDKHQFEIKAIVPLNRAQSHEFGIGDFFVSGGIAGNGSAGGWGFGNGWGVSLNTGFVAILQRIDEISQEEFDRRIAAREEAVRKKQTAIELNAKLSENTKFIADNNPELSRLGSLSIEEVTESKGIFGTKYSVGKNTFKTPELANNFIQECRDKALGSR